jgi:hypothetical protein
MTVKVTKVGDKEFSSNFHDQMVQFFKDEEATSLGMNEGKPNHNGIEMTDKIGEEIGTTTYLDVDNLILEPFAVYLMPEKYTDPSIISKEREARAKREEEDTDGDGLPAFLKMMGGGKNYYKADETMKANLAGLDFTIVDAFEFPQNDLFFKVVRNDNPEIVAWLDIHALKKTRN